MRFYLRHLFSQVLKSSGGRRQLWQGTRIHQKWASPRDVHHEPARGECTKAATPDGRFTRHPITNGGTISTTIFGHRAIAKTCGLTCRLRIAEVPVGRT